MKIIVFILTIFMVAVTLGNTANADSLETHSLSMENAISDIRMPDIFVCGFAMGAVNANSNTVMNMLKHHDLYDDLTVIKDGLETSREFCGSATRVDFQNAYISWHKAVEAVIKHIEGDARNPHTQPNANIW